MSVVKRPESIVIIRFPDCDPFNHLNNSRYIDYFINAREDHLLSHYQFSPYEYASQKLLSWVVTQNQIAYLRPATLMEKVVIQSHVLKFAQRDILVEMTMWDESKKTLKAIIWTTFTHFNFKTQRSEIHSEELAGKFKHLENELPREISFEERVKELKSAGYISE
jgi:YbgC/YbaW family acyl-CoA thioester hydrolase